MTLSEFKAWLEGFTEAIGGPPSQEQWDRIKEKVASIVEHPILTNPYVPIYSPFNLPNFEIITYDGKSFGH
jgi:hypothetical protein